MRIEPILVMSSSVQHFNQIRDFKSEKNFKQRLDFKMQKIDRECVCLIHQDRSSEPFSLL